MRQVVLWLQRRVGGGKFSLGSLPLHWGRSEPHSGALHNGTIFYVNDVSGVCVFMIRSHPSWTFFS